VPVSDAGAHVSAYPRPLPDGEAASVRDGAAVSKGYIRDDWLLPTLETLLSKESIGVLKSAAQDSYWDSAVRRGLISDDEILTALASRFHMKIANLTLATPQAREHVPESLARKYRIIPLTITDSALEIATADPHDLDCERTLAFATGRTVKMSLAAPTKIAARLDELYRPENVVSKILENVSANYDIQSIADVQTQEDMELGGEKASSERPIIRLVDHIVAEGITSRASDIHLEPEEGGVAVRYRIDGVLRQTMVLPRAAGIPLVSRIKIMSGLDIADRLRPQDGRARVAVNGVPVDLRVSTLPASHGEKVVVRILDQRATVLSLDGMGLRTDELERIRTLLQMREGVILVTGPTGSGKTTTLYSALRQIQTRGVNIVTVEDPVEYRLQGVVQVQVHEKAGLTFAAALRSILRQDPDVVLVGEVRDRETAATAVQASLTGHLVLTTLHTIDAASSITRLTDIGVESYKLAAALKGIIAQRLLRRVCPKCREVWMDAVPDRLRPWIPSGTPLFRAVGCDHCSQTGYRGRMAVVEVLVSNPEVERRISAGESVDRVADAAREGGMRSLWESGVSRVMGGETTIDELLRVLEVPQEDPGRSTTRAAPVSPGRQTAAPRDGAHGSPRPVQQEPPPASGSRDGAFELLDDGTPSATLHREHATVLLVEDEEPLRRVLRDLLEREGFTVIEAGDGVVALDEVDRGAPDIMVLDLNLPRLDGYGVLSHLRARQATSQLPVIVLTAKGDEDSEVRVFEYGASDFITKPFRPRALSARINALLGRTRQVD
jgi:type II secretory ATPase GspE/PulE/Tfp pilus assembly ATPase PilB-like protein/CheY-like chemotaxis protein